MRAGLSMECREPYISVDVDIECCRNRQFAGYKRREESDYPEWRCKRRTTTVITTTNPSRLGTGVGSFSLSVLSLLLYLQLVHSSLSPYLTPTHLFQSHVHIVLISTTGNVNVPWPYTLCSPAMLHEELSTDMVCIPSILVFHAK